MFLFVCLLREAKTKEKRKKLKKKLKLLKLIYTDILLKQEIY